MVNGTKAARRRPLAAGNWKMHRTRAETVRLLKTLAARLEERGPATADGPPGAAAGAEVVVCPPFTALGDAARALEGTGIALGAQNLHWEDEGAYTGEISAPMLVECSCRYVIVGHSERRQYFGETNETVRKRLGAAARHGLNPILCVGETWEERRAGRTEQVVRNQLASALAGFPDGPPAGLCVAYEPVWAIGTGQAARGADAQEVAGLIRQLLAGLFGDDAAAATRILYGGSVKPDNILEFSRQPDIDGALVGGASLDPSSFADIVERVAR